MTKFVLTLILLLGLSLSFAAVDVNTASEADLDGIRGIGPSLSRKILAERQKGDFKDWTDLMKRVKGIQPKSAARLSESGLTVNGQRHEPD
jgi:competence protein ComEA